jgi:putative transposase
LRKSKTNGGTGVSPVQSFKINIRNLPHWQHPGCVYFLTWRCNKNEVLSPEERAVVLNSLHYWNYRKWTLFAAVIMPDHVHALVQPLPLPKGDGDYNLAEIIHSVKSFSAHQINRLRSSRGSIWQDERYDRIMRDDAEFLEKWQYIMNNPLKWELASRTEDYP